MTEDTSVYIEISPHDVNYVNRILEGYEYLGVLTTLDVKRATCVIRSTADTRADVVALMEGLDVPVKILSGKEEALSEAAK